MLPAIGNRFKPALTLIQSITIQQQRMARQENVGPSAGQGPALTAQPKDMEAVNELYFGSQLTVTEAMTRLMERLVGYLNDQMGLGRDGSEEGKKTGNAWRREALRDFVAPGSDGDFSLPEPGKRGVTFQQVARMVLDRFDVGFLSRDTELMKELEQSIGFRLDGMNVADLLQAFADPASSSADKVRAVLSEGLAGHGGSKVSKRLERAVAGPRSVEETLADTRNPAIDEIDEETIREDLEALKAARTLEKVEQAAKLPDAVREAMDEMEEADAKAAGTKVADGVLQLLGGFGAAISTVDGRQKPDSPDPRGMDEDRPALASALRAYLQAQEREDEQEKPFSRAM